MDKFPELPSWEALFVILVYLSDCSYGKSFYRSSVKSHSETDLMMVRSLFMQSRRE